MRVQKNLSLATVCVWSALVWACGSDGDLGAIDAGKGAEADASSVEPIGGDVFNEEKIRVFSLTLPEADWDLLQANARDEQYVSASLHYDGEELDQVGLRFKGSIGSLALCFEGDTLICDKLSMKIKFSEYVKGQRLHGLKRINLHAMMGDPTKMHDAIGYKLFRDLGVKAPRLAYARVVVNGESLGLFSAVEAIDGRFARANFEDGGQGNVYKEVWPQHLAEAPYLGALKTNKTNGSAEKMLRFAQELNTAGDADFVRVFSAWVDVEPFIQHMAVSRLIDHWDGIVGWYCNGGGDACANHNYYWYESSTEDKVWLIPWDLDHTFEEPSPIRTFFGMPDWDAVNPDCTPISIFLGFMGRAPSCDPLLDRIARLYRDEYLAASQSLIDGAFSETAMNQRIDELAALIASEIAADTVSTQTSSAWQAEVASLKNVVSAKRAYIEAKLGN